ncbi:tyrosine-type recombinase/integrase [Streptomyces sp. NPDC057020]|uniref:tyrosine-type recombinase/integrase n=1 Tax=unclassified Streptomyces TaxID=2593676 RepID=UPI0036437539
MHGTESLEREQLTPRAVPRLEQRVRKALTPEKFADHLAVREGKRPDTCRTYARHVRDWLNYVRYRRLDVLAPPANELGRFCNSWYVRRDGHRVEPSTAVRKGRRQALTAYGLYLRKIGLSQGYPTGQVRIAPDKSHRRASVRTVRPDEIAALLAAARDMNPGAYAITRLLCDVGLRSWELAALRWGAWMPSNAPAIVRAGGEGRGSVVDREVGPCVVEAIQEYRTWVRIVLPRADFRPSAPMLLLPTRRFDPPVPLTSRRLDRLLSNLVERAGIDPVGVRARALRASWIRHALACFPAEEVSEAVGHASVSTTLRYAPARSIPLSVSAARVRPAVDGSVTRGVLLFRALESGEEQPGLVELMTGRTEIERLREESTLLREIEALQAERAMLRREIADFRSRRSGVAA